MVARVCQCRRARTCTACSQKCVVFFVLVALVTLLLVSLLGQSHTTTSNSGRSSNKPKFDVQSSASDEFLNTTATTPSSSLFLPLRSWELLEVVNGTLVRPKELPSRVPHTCVRGSTSAHGDILFKEKVCRNEKAFARVKEYVESMSFAASTLCDVCEIANLMRRHHWTTLTFWGDSVQNQVFHGLVCEFSRQDDDHYTVVSDKLIPTNDTMCPQREGMMQCYHSIRTVTIRDTANNYVFKIKMIMQYRPRQSRTTADDLRLIANEGTDVVVMNFGLHFTKSQRMDYQQRLERTLKALKKQKHESSFPHMVLFRETSAQHFAQTGGEYSRDTLKQPCAPVDNSTQPTDLGWRDRIFNIAAQREGYVVRVMGPITGMSNHTTLATTIDDPHTDEGLDKIYVLPFAKFSSLFYDLHPDECTHFCHTPYLWHPLWRSLRLAMEDHSS